MYFSIMSTDLADTNFKPSSRIRALTAFLFLGGKYFRGHLSFFHFFLAIAYTSFFTLINRDKAVLPAQYPLQPVPFVPLLALVLS